MRRHLHSPRRNFASNYSIDEIKRRANGRWLEILQAAGISRDLLESRRGTSCPRCGGKDRFSAMPDVANRGAVLCRHCFHGATNPRAGDGLSTLQWWLGVSLFDAVRWLADYLGEGVVKTRMHEVVQSIPINTKPSDFAHLRLFSEICHRNMKPVWMARAASLIDLTSEPLLRLLVGWSPTNRATTWPMRNGSGEIIGIRLRCPETAKKWAIKGSIAGLFYSLDLLNTEHPKRLWIVEGPTDCAAMLSLGFHAVGCPSAGGGSDLLLELCRRVMPGEIVIVADRDQAGFRGAEKLADALLIIAPIRIVSPPIGMKDARAWVTSGASREDIESAANATSIRRVGLEGFTHG